MERQRGNSGKTWENRFAFWSSCKTKTFYDLVELYCGRWCVGDCTPSLLLAGYLQTIGGSTRSKGAPLSLDDCQRSDLVVGTGGCHSVIRYGRIRFMFPFYSNLCSASDCGSSNEHLPIAKEIANTFSCFCKITSLISLVALKASVNGLVSVETPKPLSPVNPLAPESLSPWMLWFAPALTGASESPVSRLINRKGGVLLAMRHAAGF